MIPLWSTDASFALNFTSFLPFFLGHIITPMNNKYRQMITVGINQNSVLKIPIVDILSCFVDTWIHSSFNFLFPGYIQSLNASMFILFLFL